MSAPLEIQLGRLDLLNIGSNRRHCVRVLPSSKGKKQKLVCGGEDGVVQCVAVKKGETSIVFKNPPGKREVTALTLGGPVGDKDRIYVAYGQTIQGINKKKGAQFFMYATVLNEDISALYIEDLTIYTACEYSINVFEANKNGDQVSDVHFYQSPDKIHHLAMTKLQSQPSKDASYNSILACQDKHIRVIKDSDMLYDARTDGAVLTVQMYEGALPPEKKSQNGDDEYSTTRQHNFKVTSDYRQLLYGTDTGTIGQYFLDQSSMKAGFTIGKGAKKSGVTSMTLCDVTLNGYEDIVVGRDDGTVEVFQYDVYNPDSEPVFTRDLNESITTLEKGQLVANNSLDLVVSTYSGKVLTFTHELKHSSVSHIAPKISNIKDGTSVATSSTSTGLPGSITNVDGTSTNVMRESKEDLERSIRDLKMELEKLQEKVSKEKEKYTTKVSSELIALEQQFKMKHTFKLIPDEACYLLTLEIDIPLDCVTLQSNIPIMLLDTDANDLKSKSLLSRTPRDEKNSNELLATYRVLDSVTTNRLEIKIRTVEGQHGILNAYVIPKLQPKTCQRQELKIKPLSLHERVDRSTIESELKTRPLTTLTLQGAFTLSDVHAWILLCLPDVSSKVNPSSSSSSTSSSSDSSSSAVQTLFFRSTFLKTVLSCEYERGRVTFKSDSITVISILKEVLTKEATNKKINIQVDLDLKLESISTLLRLLRPELDQHFTLNKKNSLIAPLKEIATHELGGALNASGGGIKENLDVLAQFLQPSYIDILRHSDELEAQLKSAPRHLDFLRGIVTDLFVDKHKLQGRSAQSKVPQLLEILENYSFDKLIAAFKD